jgi:hypothetical protein
MFSAHDRWIQLNPIGEKAHLYHFVCIELRRLTGAARCVVDSERLVGKGHGEDDTPGNIEGDVAGSN